MYHKYLLTVIIHFRVLALVKHQAIFTKFICNANNTSNAYAFLPFVQINPSSAIYEIHEIHDRQWI